MQVRLVPMSNKDLEMKDKTVSEIQTTFFINYLKNNNGFYNFKTSINANSGDLFLFQFEGQIIASAILDRIVRFGKVDADGYRGKFYFKPDTIRIFNPISSDEFKKYTNNFSGFKRSPQYINISNFSKFIERTNKYESGNEIKFSNELLERLEISANEMNNYKVRLLVQTTDGSNPLEIYKENNSIEDWIAWKYDQDILTRPRVISFVKNYDIGKDYWLYVGTYEVTKKKNFDSLNHCVGYDIKSVGNIKDIGSLNIKFKNDAKQMIRNLENIVDSISIPNIMESNLTFNETRVKTKEEWIKVLSNEESLGKDKIIEILKFIYMSKDHISSCGTVSEYMNIGVAGINSTISSFGKRVLDLLSLPEVKGDSGQNRRWNIPFKTNFEKNKNGTFTWELRPELIAAIEEKYDWKEKYIIQNYGKHLERYERYSRKDIHDIFSPNTNFTPKTGLWGMSGIIPVPNTISDYIFLVTYGSNQSGHEFNESIDENGILEWQSQPRQTLDDNKIQDFINHDHNKSNIYLFLRENKHLDYSYLGKLAYISHDIERECPVYFKWQILDWDPNSGKISLDEKINNKDVIKKIKEKEEKIDLEQIDPKDFIVNVVNTNKIFAKAERKGKSTAEFNNRNRNFEGDAEKNTRLGNKGEDVVVTLEKKHLNSIGRYDLADQVMATRNFAGNAERFDVLSFEDDGTKKYIEVKTTTGGANNAFHISENEVSFSETFKEHYYLYRLYNFDKKTKKTDLIIIKGSINREMLTPTKYICNIGDADKSI